MKIRAGFELSYECPAPTPMLLVLKVRPEREADLLTPQELVFDPPIAARDYTDGFGNRCTRITAPSGRLTISADFLIRDPGVYDEYAPDARQHPIEELPDDLLVYLLGSRYCETDKLGDLAWSLFAGIEPGWARVQAIVDYAHKRISFGYHHACATRGAFDGHHEQVGVCRDFAHLAVTLCRCMNIPARYCTGYLGDIGVPKDPAPMDFSAWFEAYLGGRWYTFDARHNHPRMGRIVMAHGRDATDVALSTSFGASQLVGFKVVTDEVEDVAAE
jgi:transglutaminase-like putative cysteine protease